MNMEFQSLKQATNHRRQKLNKKAQPKMSKAATTHSSNSKSRLLCSSLIILIVLLANGITKINAVPTDSTGAQTRPVLLRRALRDVAAMMTAARLVQEEPKDIVATSTETLLDQPQGQCLLDGVLVAETAVECEQKVGCRAIQKTGHCCPDYKCDCQKDGKTYSNGDKLVDPETPCTVCYCKGGEILCSSAVCFHRDDCTPRYIPNRCCPEYDNCPVTNKTMVSSTIAPKPELPQATALNLNITIKEITKPTEIRITDENKAKPIHQMLKTSTTTTTTTTTTEAPQSSSSYTTEAPISSSTTATILTLIKDPENYPFADGPSSSSFVKKHEAAVVVPRESHDNLNSQELKNVDHEELGNGSSKINIKREFMYVTTDGPSKANFNESNGELSSAELLNWNAELSGANSGLLLTDSDLDPETAGSDNIYHIILSTDGPGENYASSTVDETVPKISSITEGFNPETSNGSSALPFTTESEQNFESSTAAASKPTDPSTEAPEMKKATESTTAATSTTATMKTSTHHIEEEDTALPIEANPAYPSLPEDDFSIRDVNMPLSETEDTADADLKDQSRSYADHLAASKAMEDAGMVDSGSGSGSGLNIVMSMKDTPSISEDVKRPSSTSSPILEKVQLMYSMEEASSAETTITNGTDFQMENLMRGLAENDTGSGDSLEMMSSLESIIDSDFGSGGGSGNGSGEAAAPLKMMKEREPTTPRPMSKVTTELDLDELGNASGDGKLEPVDDPKLDAESLKADEEENDGVAQADSAAPKSDIISVKLNPKQEKTLEEQQLPVQLSV